MKEILHKYIGKELGINLEKPYTIDSAKLLKVEDNYFSIEDHTKKYVHYFSYNSIVQIIESKDGVEIGGMFKHHKVYPLVVKVGHIVEYIPA